MQKFEEGNGALSERRNIIVMADEARRRRTRAYCRRACFLRRDHQTAVFKDLYENEELIAITKELADKLRKNRTIDWQKRDSARAKMHMMIRKLVKDHRYSPEGMDDAVTTVMSQCELWADNIMNV